MLDNTEAIMVMLQHTQTTLLIEWDPCCQAPGPGLDKPGPQPSQPGHQLGQT